MDYKKTYDSIISKAQSENRKKSKEIYFESHHILPKCMGGGEENNKVFLTAREHYVCHKILHYIYPNNSALALAYHSMAYMKKDKRKLKLTSREYEEVRIAHSIAMTGENNPMFGKEKSPEAIAKQLETMSKKPQSEIDDINRRISESLSGENHPNYNKSINPKSKEAFRIYNLTKVVDQETRDLLSILNTGRERSDEDIQKQKNTIEKNGGVWNKGKTDIYSEESLEKNRQAHLGKTMSPDSIAKQIETKNNRTQEEKEAERIKKSNAQKGNPKNPVSVAKSTATRKRQRINKLPENIRVIEEEKLIMIF